MLLREYYPNFLVYDSQFGQMLDVIQPEINSLEQSRLDLIDQFFIDTATWGLSVYESFLGIKTDISKLYDYRRSVIKSRLAGIGTTTIQMLKDMSLSFSNGEVDVIEYPAESRFVIKFIGLHGIPPNYDDYKQAVYIVKPAHLGVTYEFRFLIWDELDSKNMTWNQLDAKALTWDQFEEGGWLNV